MNDMERSIIQEKKTVGKVVWNSFRKIGKLQYFNEKGEMTGDSKTLPVFPEYRLGGTGRIVRFESYVRRRFWHGLKRRWYLIPIITEVESPRTFFDAEFVSNNLKRHQQVAYNYFLHYKYAKPLVRIAFGTLTTQLLDLNQEDEKTRLGVGL
jgi:hypothetical protein